MSESVQIELPRYVSRESVLALRVKHVSLESVSAGQLPRMVFTPESSDHLPFIRASVWFYNQEAMIRSRGIRFTSNMPFYFVVDANGLEKLMSVEEFESKFTVKI